MVTAIRDDKIYFNNKIEEWYQLPYSYYKFNITVLYANDYNKIPLVLGLSIQYIGVLVC